ncbi:MAG: CBS domain-containing protein [Acidobacteria bacterium]|nr:CBS domain-containing protein [Acidobacteriota bacterium]
MTRVSHSAGDPAGAHAVNACASGKPAQGSRLARSASVGREIARVLGIPEVCVRVRDLMKTDIGACAPDDDLMTVLLLMRERECGWAPVVNGRGVVCGVITDRDVAMAMLNHPSRGASRLSARDAMTTEVIGCTEEDGLQAVLDLMSAHHVRRLPVLDARRHLRGVISVDDLVRAPQARGIPTPAALVEALRLIISRPRVSDV